MAGAPLVDYWRLKVFLLLDGPGADVLTFILKNGTNTQSLPVQLDKYLTDLPDSSTANYVKLKNKEKKKTFNPSELRQIQKYPLWNNFDVSLLFKAISLACERIDDTKFKDQNEMEGLITKIKDERNAIVHEKKLLTEVNFLAKVNELESIYMNVLIAAKVRYNVTDSHFKPVWDTVFQDIRSIKKALTAKEILERDIKDLLPLFMEQSKKHLANLYKHAQCFDPLSFLSGSTMGNIHIQSIFCNISLKEKTHVIKTADIDSLDLLTYTQPTFSQDTPSTEDKKPQFIVITGDAGSGKTTLLTLILSEWIKDADDCRIKYLTEYDIVLRILCRENDGPSLQNFLQQVLPNIFDGIKDSLVALLKECKVIFLIDGVDELSPGSPSDQLVTDILNKGKDVPGFTVICTSRPESVKDFLANTPGSYKRHMMEMKGVSIAHRTDFVLRHYDSFPPHSNKDTERLKHLMECTGWRDHFRLPLNLLFVATLFYTDLNSVKNTTTQTSLYINIHEWCVQKLQDRLARHRQDGRDWLTREESIKVVLKVMYQVALDCLLHDNLSLSDADVRWLKDCCREENLSSTEVMGAFLCLREDVAMLVRRQKYFAPHKSLQEFYAAKKIVENIEEGLSAGSVRRMLLDPSPPEMNKLKNLLLHVAGLLSQPGVPFIPGAIQEVVDLLAETGVKKCVDWLLLLEDTEVNSTALKHVAETIIRTDHIAADDDDDDVYDNDDMYVKITDSTINSAAALLPLIPSREIRIELQRMGGDTIKLCRSTAGHICTELFLWHHYKQPDHPPASDPILRALPRRHLEYFMGHLSHEGIEILQEFQHLQVLSLAVSGDKDAPAILSALAAARPSLRHLLRLRLHVPVKKVAPEVLKTSLPNVLDGCGNSRVRLVLSGVEENLLEKTRQIAAALQPSVRRYWTITFPDSSIKAAACRRLINMLAEARVMAMNIWIPNTIINKREEVNLKTLVKNRMHGDIMTQDNNKLWKLF